jgi:hypothetical protein
MRHQQQPHSGPTWWACLFRQCKARLNSGFVEEVAWAGNEAACGSKGVDAGKGLPDQAVEDWRMAAKCLHSYMYIDTLEIVVVGKAGMGGPKGRRVAGPRRAGSGRARVASWTVWLAVVWRGAIMEEGPWGPARGAYLLMYPCTERRVVVGRRAGACGVGPEWKWGPLCHVNTC